MTIEKDIEDALVETAKWLMKSHDPCDHLGAQVVFNWEHQCYEMVCPNCGTVGYISAVEWNKLNGEAN